MGTKRFGAWASMLVAFVSMACGGSSTPAAATSPATLPTSDAVTQYYVSMVEGYWAVHIAADGVSGGINEASRACLGTINDVAPRNESLVEPAKCHERGVLILASQEKFMAELKGAIAPEQFADDDRIFRRDVPKTIVLLKAMNSAAAAGNKRATFDAASSYAEIMVTWVVGALDDVDPSTHHY